MRRAATRAERRWVVLIAEDNPDERDLYRRYLTSRGLTVLVATDGDEALRVAQEARPDVIVLDLRMPHIDGWQATRRLKQEPATRHIPVIACTGHVVGRAAELALAAGCDAYLVKPCLPADLLAAIRTVLSERTGPPPRRVVDGNNGRTS